MINSFPGTILQRTKNSPVLQISRLQTITLMVRRCSGFEIRSNVREKIPLDASDHPTILDHVGNNN